MPLIDMPVQELREYKGSSPCPDDIDAFWDESLEEMRALDPKLEITPADFCVPFAECYDLRFTGVGGARIYAKLVKPKDAKEAHPAVLKFHGYTISSGSWIDLLPYAAAGYTIAALDCRGQGGLSEDVGGVTGNTLNGHIIRGVSDGPEKLLFRNVYLDCAQLAGIVMDMEDVDETRVGCFGGSQGGGLALACASLEPRIKLTAALFPFLSDYKRAWDMDMVKIAYKELQTWFRLFDPRHERQDYFFHTLGYIDIQNLVHRIRAEVLMFTGLMDTTCPPSTQFAAYNKITSEKRIILYPDFDHENLPGSSDDVIRFLMKL